MSENETQTMEQTEMPGFYSKKFKKDLMKLQFFQKYFGL